MEKIKCMRSTLLSGLTSIKITRSRPGTRSTRRYLRQEGVDPLARALLQSAGRPVLENALVVLHKDYGKIGRDCSGSQNLLHQQMWLEGPPGDHGGRCMERPAVTAGAVNGGGDG